MAFDSITRSLSSSYGHLTLTPLYVLAQRTVYVRLIAAPVLGMPLEPDYDVCLQPQRDLLLYGPVE